MKAAQVDPHLMAAQASHLTMFEDAITSGLAERLGTNLSDDPYPVVLASAAIGVIRAIISILGGVGGAVGLDTLTDSPFECSPTGCRTTRA